MGERVFEFSIDRGGTFTDVYATIKATGKSRLLKLLSDDPANYPDAPREGIRKILEEETGIPHPRDDPLDTSRIANIRMGTTVATNALLERKGERCALVTTKGFKDLLLIGNQSRRHIFDLVIARPELLYERVVEVDERVVLLRDGEGNGMPDSTQEKSSPDGASESSEPRIVTGVTGEKLIVTSAPDMAVVRRDLCSVLEQGITSLAVVFLHSYTFGEHERAVGKLAEELGFKHISLSSEVIPMVKAVSRGYTTCADAYLTPVIMRYIASFRSGFDENFDKVQTLFMQSDGGLTPVQYFRGSRAILSGPAGGVVGYASTAYDKETKQPIVGLDMGGTSSDVSRFAGSYEHVFETVTAGITLQSPQLDISTVAAGGGSRLFFRGNLFVVGPESAGAHPGPICYRKGGYLAVTDANVFLGRVIPKYFPKIFGPNEDQELDAEGAALAFEEMALIINTASATSGAAIGASHNYAASGVKSAEEVAYGFLQVAIEAMCRPIRNLTTMKGYDVTTHALACFGGAGPQFCCAIAQALGMKRIKVHRLSGVLSAYGLSLADVVCERQEPCAVELCEASYTELESRFAGLEAAARKQLTDQGFDNDTQITCERHLNLRFSGTDTSLMTTADNMASFESFFRDNYVREFGFLLHGRPILVDDVRVRAVGHSRAAPQKSDSVTSAQTTPPSPKDSAPVYWQGLGRVPTPVYLLGDLKPGHAIRGPAVLIQDVSTVVIEPDCEVIVTADNDLEITVGESHHRTTAEEELPSTSSLSQRSPELSTKDTVQDPTVTSTASSEAVHEGGYIIKPVQTLRTERATSIESINVGGPSKSPAPSSSSTLSASGPPDPIHLSIFAHRFMGIAEQMGRTLQRTSVSVNIKERLDFSCALFDGQGGLVANAPHLPVHLGAMQEAVKYQIHHWGMDGLSPGDVLVSNHPQLAGGSHLPDITVMTPVFVPEKKEPKFFVASRGHHADVGGIAPGSMPPLSKSLSDEGAAIVAYKLVEKGEFKEEGISKLLECSRNLPDNISDLKAQVAANTRGAQLMMELAGEYSLAIVEAYMGHIQTNAEIAVRDMLLNFSIRCGLPEVGSVTAIDYLDDGTPIQLKVTIDRRDRSAIFDFAGTGPEVYGNLNAPPAVTASAVIYTLRCMVPGVDIPLNQGCLVPVKIIIPPGSILMPSQTAAVVGGNVLTSQRVTDVILKAFGACAASQGCMNNLTLGDEKMGYYETIAGGAGAGPGWHGCSGVHTHMTNTRITDPETLERRYPVLLLQFGIREGSGGTGLYKGGDGVIRKMLFRRKLAVSILSERRAFQPFGLEGGGPGARGLNLLQYRDGRVISLGGKNTIHVNDGDALTIYTPGGGGYGSPADAQFVPPNDMLPLPGQDTLVAQTLVVSGRALSYQLDQEQA